MIRCKFYCQSKTESYDSYGKKFLFNYKFNAVHGGGNASDDNKKFWEYTPYGELSVTSVKDGTFIPGKEYYIDISEAS